MSTPSSTPGERCLAAHLQLVNAPVVVLTMRPGIPRRRRAIAGAALLALGVVVMAVMVVGGLVALGRAGLWAWIDG